MRDALLIVLPIAARAQTALATERFCSHTYADGALQQARGQLPNATAVTSDRPYSLPSASSYGNTHQHQHQHQRAHARQYQVQQQHPLPTHHLLIRRAH